MTDTTAIEVQPRDVIGKANRRLKSAGQIPAVLYGTGREATALAVDRHDFEYMMQHHGTGATIVKMKIAGESDQIDAIIKDVQVSPVKGHVIHIDFMTIRMDEVLQAAAPMNFVGDSPGVKEGGVLLHDLREFSIEALPKDLPESIDVDISQLELGGSMSVADVTAPAGVTILDDPETTICSVTLPTIEEEVVAEGEELIEEPELIGEDDDKDAE